ncbi:MAG TPA: helix-turn-helix transcriptional regulator [Longimicrobium sp.]|nr:helix-turn-helix transcriptional regulator [Longimicrobium sp.]
MLPVELQTPDEILQGVARRARALRLERGWTQGELARRSGIALDTLKRFEQTGRIALERLVAIAVVLGAVQPLGDLFAPGPARTLADLERRDAAPQRAPRARRKAR